SPDDQRPGLPPPKFGMRFMFWMIGILCALLAIMTTLDAYGIFATILLALAIAAHVIATAIGHKLRDAPTNPSGANSERGPLTSPIPFAPTTQLSQRRGPGKFIIISTIVWSVMGGGGGAVLLVYLNGERANITNVTAGAFAFAALGAMAGFALAAFLQELFGAWWQAKR
ncbi:MAG TPA: hypothetical protein VL096_19845, partial [Pirellulaceae bacterium]|nr:hypothetical protein [Pirellulaceae bacterium]